VLVVTRTEAISVLHWVIVAPITRILRYIPTEIALDIDNGLPDDSVASFDNMQPIRRSLLTERVGQLALDQSNEICRALRALADC
jgi:mRNA interferase MazF